MKNYFRLSFGYAILAMIFGVFYREFTKFNGFNGQTSLGVVHTHAFVMGMLFFMIVLLMEKQFDLSSHKRNTTFLFLYNAGLLLTIIMLVVRGITQVMGVALSPALDAGISGFAGIGHILLGIGILLFFRILKQQLK